MGLPFVTFAAQPNGNIFLSDEQSIIGGMRGMTADTIARFYRLAQAFVFGIIN
jgi:hypothetical protein